MSNSEVYKYVVLPNYIPLTELNTQKGLIQWLDNQSSSNFLNATYYSMPDRVRLFYTGPECCDDNELSSIKEHGLFFILYTTLELSKTSPVNSFFRDGTVRINWEQIQKITIPRSR